MSDPASSRGSWQSEEYVARWAAGDSLADVLVLPRRLSAALVRDAGTEVRHVIDLGAGSGAYLEVMLEAFPAARGTWIDSSPPMLERARQRLGPLGDRVDFTLADARDPSKLGLGRTDADVTVSSRAIHHFSTETIASLYRAAFDALRPGGFLFNLDHFATPADWEPRYRRVRPVFVPRRGEREAHEHDAPPQPLEAHLRWLAEAGFEAADVPWRLLWTALVAARRPRAGTAG